VDRVSWSFVDILTLWNLVVLGTWSPGFVTSLQADRQDGCSLVILAFLLVQGWSWDRDSEAGIPRY
jgi:hypothetical protein